MRKIRGDEPIGTIIHIYREVPQGNSLCIYLKQVKMSFFSLYKIREQEGRTGSTSGRGEERVNIVQILCTHVYKWKNDIC
jgi:hypothetical protein